MTSRSDSVRLPGYSRIPSFSNTSLQIKIRAEMIFQTASQSPGLFRFPRLPMERTAVGRHRGSVRLSR